MEAGKSSSDRRAAFIVAVAMTMLIATAPTTLAAFDRAAGAGEPAWSAALRRVDDALSAGNAADAARALHQAYLAALGSRRWDGMVAVGDAARRVGHATQAERIYDPRARQAYLVALFRARHERSAEGVMRVAEAFGALGDAEVAKRCQRAADSLLLHRLEDSRTGARDRPKS